MELQFMSSSWPKKTVHTVLGALWSENVKLANFFGEDELMSSQCSAEMIRVWSVPCEQRDNSWNQRSVAHRSKGSAPALGEGWHSYIQTYFWLQFEWTRLFKRYQKRPLWRKFEKTRWAQQSCQQCPIDVSWCEAILIVEASVKQFEFHYEYVQCHSQF